MRKGIAEGQSNIHFDLKTLKDLQKKGYKYVQVKGLTTDKHYDYTDPQIIVLVPLKELSSDPNKKDIYEPIESEILEQWATETDDNFEIVIGKPIA